MKHYEYFGPLALGFQGFQHSNHCVRKVLNSVLIYMLIFVLFLLITNTLRRTLTLSIAVAALDSLNIHPALAFIFCPALAFQFRIEAIDLVLRPWQALPC
jgi:hypothetical protein